jgi:Zn-dependent peptidase ImmA (M78 family)
VGTFTPSRLILARRRRGLTISVLAARIGLSTRRLSAFEHGDAVPTEATLAALALALDFPRSAFSAPDVEMPTSESASFRALTSMTAAQRDSALGAGAIAMMLSAWIDERFRLPAVDVATLRDEDPEAAAAALRALWGLGEQPVRNMVHLLEVHGVRVFSLEERGDEVDAFSLWRNDVPFVFLNTGKSGERSRFDAAHELGHLVMHRHGGPQGREAETEADRFASAFLMPRGSVLAHAPRFASYDALIQIKKIWKVSVAAIAYRLRTVGALSEWHYRQLAIEISNRGARKREPEGIPREMSQVLSKVLTALRDEGVTKADIARDLSIPVTELDTLVFGLAMVALDGKSAHGAKLGSSARTSSARTASRSADLHLVWNRPAEDDLEASSEPLQLDLLTTLVRVTSENGS